MMVNDDKVTSHDGDSDFDDHAAAANADDDYICVRRTAEAAAIGGEFRTLPERLLYTLPLAQLRSHRCQVEVS